MSRFNLKKGDRFSLSKESGLNKIQVDLTWKSGADLDASAFLLGADGVIMDDADFVFTTLTIAASLGTAKNLVQR